MTTQTLSDSSQLLRYALRGNGLFSLGSGLVSLLGAGALAAFTGVPAPAVFVGLGLILLLYGADLLWFASRPTINQTLAQTAVVLDILWVLGSIAILLLGQPPLTIAGKWTVALLAEAVAIFAVLQYIGIRRLTR